MNPNHKKKALAIILLLIMQATSFAQNRNATDSLKNIINNKTAQDTTIINTYLDLSSEYQDFNLDTALSYADLALNKSLKINYKKGIAEAYRQKGSITIYLDNYKFADSLLNIALNGYKEINNQQGIMKCYISLSANAYYKGENRLMLTYCMKALKIAENNNFIKDKARILGHIGVVYTNLGDYEQAITNQLQALEIFEKLNNKEMIAVCKLNLGYFFIYTNELDKSTEYLNRALKQFIEFKHTREQSTCLSNIGIVYEKQKKYDEALQNYIKALELDKKNNDLRRISKNYLNIGIIYFYMGKYNKAAEYYNKSLKIIEQIGDKRGIAICYLYIAKLEAKLKNYKFAEEYCLKSTELFEQNEDLDNQQSSLEQLANIYSLTGKYQKAYKTHIKADVIKDSLFTIEKAQKIAQLEEKYLNEKLEKQNLTLKYENEIQQTKINHHKKTHIIYITGLFLTLIAITLILIQYREKNNAYKFLVQKNIDLLNKEKELKGIREQKVVNKSNNNKTAVTDNLKEEIFNKLKQLLDNEKVFKNVDLTIVKLSNQLLTNRTYLSQLINEEFVKSYIDFINEYRIKEAILMFSDPEKSSKLTIAGLAKEAGFKSVSSFNVAFKKYSGITPSRFRLEVNEQIINV